VSGGCFDQENFRKIFFLSKPKQNGHRSNGLDELITNPLSFPLSDIPSQSYSRFEPQNGLCRFFEKNFLFLVFANGPSFESSRQGHQNSLYAPPIDSLPGKSYSHSKGPTGGGGGGGGGGTPFDLSNVLLKITAPGNSISNALATYDSNNSHV